MKGTLIINLKDMKFPVGEVVVTSGVHNLIQTNADFALFVSKSFTKHCNGDWGDLCEEDKKTNEEALKYHYRILSKYEFNGETSIYIITEWDRSVTTILFPSEY